MLLGMAEAQAEAVRRTVGGLLLYVPVVHPKDFDVAIAYLVRRLEEIYWQMQGEAERGETPVPDLRNLDIYYEIGTELAAQNIEFESEQAYRDRYRAQLAALDDYSPLSPDARLWPASAVK